MKASENGWLNAQLKIQSMISENQTKRMENGASFIIVAPNSIFVF
jgi:hypothetical protein